MKLSKHLYNQQCGKYVTMTRYIQYYTIHTLFIIVMVDGFRKLFVWNSRDSDLLLVEGFEKTVQKGAQYIFGEWICHLKYVSICGNKNKYWI